jgi:hypothetical protein
MRIHLLAPAIAALLAGIPAVAQVASGQEGQIRGVILDDADRPVAGARVTLIRPGKLTRGAGGRWRNSEVPFAAQAVSDLAGNYQLAKLPAAGYDICIEAPGYLTTCEWQQWGRAAVAAGASVDHGVQRLIRAALVTIRLDDPRNLLRPDDKYSAPMIAVRDQFNRFHPARRSGKQGTTHILHVEAPYDTPLMVRIHSARFRLTNAQGSAVSVSGEDVAFNAPRGGAPLTFTFAITGESSQIEWPPVSMPPPGTAAR